MILLLLAGWLPFAIAQEKAPGSIFDQNLLNLRDPFLAPFHEPVQNEEKSELERFSVRDYQLVGVLTGPDRTRAVISDPLGKVHFVKKMMKLGSLGGVVIQISPNSITVREKRLSMLGRSESLDTVLFLKKIKKE